MGMKTMTEKEHSRFRICIEDHEPHPEEISGEPLQNAPRPGRLVVPYLSILLFCILGAALGFGYFDMSRRLDRLKLSNNLELDTMSKSFEKQLLSRTEDQQEIMKAGLKKDVSIEKEIAQLKGIIQELDKKFTTLDASKPDKKEIETLLGKTDQSLSAIQKELSALAGSVGAMEKKIAGESSKFSQTLGKMSTDLQNIQSRIATLSAEKLDKQILDIKFKTEQRIYRQALNEAMRSMESKFHIIDGKLESLEKTQGNSGQKSLLRQAPVADPASVKPGKITEQDIKD
jgi:chromosome segregation ATPase